GRIAVGSDADLVVWDPSAKRTISAETHHQAVDFNIFEGMACHGVPLVTIAGGVVAWENGELSVVKGSGRFVSLPANSPYVFGAISQRGKMMAPRKVDRQGGSAKAAAIAASPSPPAAEGKQESKQEGFYTRETRSGGRHMQDSTWSASGQQRGEGNERPSSKVLQPPGGKTSILF
uniref:Amidohydrolase-related domain-containing protein n=1 Tax=Plectus sambesii TaxID=2011161 RepID=A0A914VAZ9_9BILA